MFVNNLDGQAIYIAGKFKRSQYEDAYDDFVSRYGKPDDRLGDPGDQRSIWFLKNGVAVMRERAAKIGEGSAAFSLFCFAGGNERVAQELNADCKKLFKPAAICTGASGIFRRLPDHKIPLRTAERRVGNEGVSWGKIRR